MKNKILLISSVALALSLTACDDEVMEWGTPDGHYAVSDYEIPLEIAEQLQYYDYIKAYAPSNITVGLGLDASMYLDKTEYRQVCDDNYQIFTCGNEMKHGVVCSSSGKYNFDDINNYLAKLDPTALVYGHNFIWHTQQNQTYLKSLIAPTMNMISDGSDIINLIDNFDFEAGNIDGWAAWSSAGCSAVLSGQGEGHDSDYALKLNNPTDGVGANWSAQAYYTLPSYDWSSAVGETFVIQCDIYAPNGWSDFQMELQDRNSYSSNNYFHNDESGDAIPSGKWTTWRVEKVIADYGSGNSPTHLTIDFGAASGDLYIDNIQFGPLNEEVNYCSNGSFEDGVDEGTGYPVDWTLNNEVTTVVELEDAIDGTHVLQMAPVEDGNPWDVQATSNLLPVLDSDVEISFWVKASESGGKGRLSFSSDMSNQWPWMNWTGSQSSWTEYFDVSTDWLYISVIPQNFSVDFVEGASTWKFNLEFGYTGGITYYIDDVKVTAVEEENKSLKASSYYYTLMDDEKKKANLLVAMEEWIKSISEDIHDKIGDRLVAWDVINEPILDGGGGYRGIDGFGGTSNDGIADSTPVETESDGLTLNWASDTGNQHFYWGYYLGMEYATKAFEYARKYNPDALLFVNEYNLENSEAKLAKLIEFVQYIDANGEVPVDGIGTQMHLELTTGVDDAEVEDLNNKVDNMFRTLAATGKIIRVTELDVSLNTGSPSAAQQAYQADVYQHVVEAYLSIIPSSQQSGITFWTLSDAAAEHEYWLSDCAPNLFDKDYNRKHAYKGVCNGLAGYDISDALDGTMWYNSGE